MRGFILGTLVGGLVAALLAPRRGEETRGMVWTALEQWQDRMMLKMDEAKSEIESLRREMMVKLDDLRSDAVATASRPLGDVEGPEPDRPSSTAPPRSEETETPII